MGLGEGLVLFSSLEWKVGTKLSPLVVKPTMWFLNRSDTNRAEQPQEMAKGLKFWI